MITSKELLDVISLKVEGSVNSKTISIRYKIVWRRTLFASAKGKRHTLVINIKLGDNTYEDLILQ